MRRIKTARILGRKWAFRWEPIDAEDKAVGLCFKTEHQIQIDPAQRGRAMLDTLIHETLHGADHELSEARVERCAEAVSGVLWKVGYRCG